ncbi:unnamed protein product, partial [Schistosoma turkestanicum]
MISDFKKTLIQSLSSKSWPSEEDRSGVLKSVENISVSTENLDRFLGDTIVPPSDRIEKNMSEGNYFMNVYNSQKTNYLDSIYRVSVINV